MRAAPVVEQIIDERWATIGDTINGWRGSMAAGRCSYDFALNAANTKNLRIVRVRECPSRASPRPQGRQARAALRRVRPRMELRVERPEQHDHHGLVLEYPGISPAAERAQWSLPPL